MDYSKSQQEMETMFMQHFGGTNRVLWYFFKVVFSEHSYQNRDN